MWVTSQLHVHGVGGSQSGRPERMAAKRYVVT